MTTPIDPIERHLPEALTDLASPRTPDYYIDILGQTARVRQRPAWLRPGRWIGMNGFLGRPQLVAVIVVLVAIVGGGMFLMQRNQATVGTPSASPTASPVSSAPSGNRPPGLAAALSSSDWLGDHRPVVGPGAGAALRFGPTSVSVTQANVMSAAVLTSSAYGGGDPSQLILETGAGDKACQTGDRGTYRWAVSARDLTLTLDVVQDACAARSAAIAGTWWRMGCKLAGATCLGDLDAGTYKSEFIAPRLDPGAPWTADVGGVTYTVPVGWANSADSPNDFHLTPSEDFAMETAGGPQSGLHEIWIGVAPHANKVTPDCGPSVDGAVDGTVDGLLAWIAKQPALTSTTPEAIEIDGHLGKWIDIRLAHTWTTTCTSFYGDQPERAFLTYPPGTSDDTWTATLAGPEQDRLILVDLGAGKTIAIVVDSYFPSGFDSLAFNAMPIIQSLKFQ